MNKKKKYITPKFIVADIAAVSGYLSDDLDVYSQADWIDTEAKRFDEWGDEIEDESEDDEFYSW